MGNLLSLASSRLRLCLLAALALLSGCGPIWLAQRALRMPWNAVDEVKPGSSIDLDGNKGYVVLTLEASRQFFILSAAEQERLDCIRWDHVNIAHDGGKEMYVFAVPPGTYYATSLNTLPSETFAVQQGDVIYLGHYTVTYRPGKVFEGWRERLEQRSMSDLDEVEQALRTRWGVGRRPAAVTTLPSREVASHIKCVP